MTNKSIVLITGSSSGIGAALATHFANKGEIVVLTYNKNRDQAETIFKTIQSKSEYSMIKHLDVTSEDSVKSLMEEIEKRYEKLDILINNAGTDKPTPIETCTYKEWREILSTKLDGNFLCTKYSIPLLKKSENPNIIVISSVLSDKPDPDDPAYSVASAGAICFANTMALALAKYKIRTNIIAPGAIKTNLEYWKINNSSEIWDKMGRNNPLQRNAQMSDITHSIDFIIDKESLYINGNIFYVNGGSHLKCY
jgi:3-oxoacyl-[acyl-carrier protein] reductase